VTGLMRTSLLFAAPALTGGDQPHGLVGSHAAHRAGGVHRPEDHAATPQQEFRRLNVAAVFLPPGTEQLGFLFGHAVGNGKGQATVDHLLGLLQGIDAGGIDGGPQRL
jgi:hypothetical protein